MKVQHQPESSLEIERRFLVPTKPEVLPDVASTAIRQGYLELQDDATVQLRQEGKQFFLNVKRGQGESAREEDLVIGRKHFEALWPLTRGRRLRKRRYLVPQGESSIQVTVYRRKLKGLILAKVQFANKESAREFSAPEWFGNEVTEVAGYCEHDLALQGIPKENTVEKEKKNGKARNGVGSRKKQR